ncbi:MAG: glycerol-3-phosphate acyltransferase [Anaerolineales bacterium]|nr:glycerol-3-phosphate acyltransferase [Anaerolineales bacterium]
MSNLLFTGIAALIGYLVGSLPFGYFFIHLFKGEDIRKHGSGRTGGTNAMRAGGLWLGILTALADIAKGAGTIWIARAIVTDPAMRPWAEILAGVFAVMGHNWSIFLGFKGGAGTAPNLGVAIVLWAPLGLFAVIVGIAVILLTGFASVTSMAIAIAIPIGLIIHAATGAGSWIHPLYGISTACAVFVALLPNIKRLLAGNERMVGPRAKAQRQVQRSKQSS